MISDEFFNGHRFCRAYALYVSEGYVAVYHKMHTPESEWARQNVVAAYNLLDEAKIDR